MIPEVTVPQKDVVAVVTFAEFNKFKAKRDMYKSPRTVPPDYKQNIIFTTTGGTEKEVGLLSDTVVELLSRDYRRQIQKKFDLLYNGRKGKKIKFDIAKDKSKQSLEYKAEPFTWEVEIEKDFIKVSKTQKTGTGDDEKEDITYIIIAKQKKKTEISYTHSYRYANEGESWIGFNKRAGKDNMPNHWQTVQRVSDFVEEFANLN